NEFYGSNPQTDTLIQEQISRVDNQNFSLSFNYKEPLGNNNYLDAYYNQRNYNSDRIKRFFDLDPMDRTVKQLNELLSTTFNNDVIYNRVGLGWTKSTDKYYLITRFDYQRSKLKGGLTTEDKVGYSYDYFLPSLEYRHS